MTSRKGPALVPLEVSDIENVSNSTRILGTPEMSLPKYNGFSDLINTKSIRTLFNKYYGEINLGKKSQKTLFYTIKPLSPDVAQELSGQKLYIKLLTGIPEDYIKKEAEINMLLAADGNPYVSEILGYEVFNNKTGLFLFNIPPGKTLKEFIRNIQQVEKKCSPKRYVKIIDELLRGLHTIHSKGILHRDIKPDNIYIPDDPAKPTYYLDFGESSYFGENSKNYRLRGTRSYAKPNKLAGMNDFQQLEYDISDDMYALKLVVDKLIANCPKELRNQIKTHFFSEGAGEGAAAPVFGLMENSEGLPVENQYEIGFGMMNLPAVVDLSAKKPRLAAAPVPAPAEEASAAFVSHASAAAWVPPKWNPNILKGLPVIPEVRSSNEYNSEAEGGCRVTRRKKIRIRKTRRRISR